MDQEPEVLTESQDATVAPPEPVAASEPQPDAPAPVLAQWEVEVETFWRNVFANVSGRVETSVHNYLLTETEALKARLKSLF